MGGTLRVDPDSLRAAARAQSDVGAAVAGLDVGAAMSSAGAGVSGLACAGACDLVGTVVDTALGAVGDELTDHSEKLRRAAELYQRADRHSGDGIRRVIG